MFYLVVGFVGLLLTKAELMRSMCDDPYRPHDDLFHAECGNHYPTKDPTLAPTQCRYEPLITCCLSCACIQVYPEECIEAGGVIPC